MVGWGQPRASGYEDREPSFLRMTPLELDSQLQATELIFRSMLEGKRIGVTKDDIDDWYGSVLGMDWVEKNARQRAEVLRQNRENGENTPEWMESLAHMGDIAWEMLESGERGERVRGLKDIDRTEIIEQFKELRPKISDSHYARCGAGDRLYGLRACIAILRVFVCDPEVLDHCVSCMKLVISNNDYNRDGLLELTVPMPPLERVAATHKDHGWSFLRAALDAYMTQGGAESVSPPAEVTDGVDHAPRRQVAIKIADLMVTAKRSPALAAQLALLREATPKTACSERKELKRMLPLAVDKTQQLLKQEAHPALEEFLQMLSSAVAGSKPDPA